VELFNVLVAFVIFVLAWHTRRVQDNRFLLFIGIASLFTGALDLAHTLAYKGMGVFPGYTADLPTQLWIAFRYLFSLSFLAALFFVRRTVHPGATFAGYLAVTLVLFFAIFSGRFPACFVEGTGLTQFKIISEYVICGIFLASLGLLFANRKAFDRRVLHLMTGAAFASMLSELSFTRYVSVYGPANMIGHYFLLLSVALIYRAIVMTGVEEPSRLLFRNLKLSEEALRRANTELEAFSYSVSHDLRAPLRSIDGFSHAVLEDYGDRLDDAGRDYVGRIRNAARAMAQLIDGFLSLSRQTRGEPARVPVNLSALAATVADDLRKAEPARTATFTIAENMAADGDPLMLRAAVENLLSNAWKFTAQRPEARIEFGVARKDGKDVYFVRDNGAGFDMTYAKKLFAPFQRLHSADEFPGIGIGLATVQRIIHRQGGSIWAEGEPGKGATFYFTLG
jgi:signal transduction histidine kinase